MYFFSHREALDQLEGYIKYVIIIIIILTDHNFHCNTMYKMLNLSQVMIVNECKNS